jgi:flagellar hook-basal body complex protein FliE
MDAIKTDRFPVFDGNISPKTNSKLDEPKTSFSNYLKESINKVNSLQKEANLATERLVSGKEKDIHNTMIALKKAEVSFELIVQIQNKLLTAYDELKRMQI